MQPEMLKSCMNITKIRYPVAIEGIINSNTKIIFSIQKIIQSQYVDKQFKQREHI